MFEPDERNRLRYDDLPTWRTSAREWWESLDWASRAALFVIAVVAIIIVVASLVNRNDPATTIQRGTPQVTAPRTSGYLGQYGGSPSVYSQIASDTDCRSLQATFDRAASNNDRADAGATEFNWTLGYMKASDERMSSIGCYGG